MAIRSVGTETFWRQYRGLPEPIRRLAREAYQRFLQNPWYPSFNRKKPRALEHYDPPIYEFRITRQYRALCQVEGEEYRWIFIGDHVAFDREIRRLSS
jgi:hypothetical protein